MSRIETAKLSRSNSSFTLFYKYKLTFCEAGLEPRVVITSLYSGLALIYHTIFALESTISKSAGGPKVKNPGKV